jgi:hypothetical protein
VNSLLLQNREWLIQPDALRSMIAAADSFRALGNPVVRDQASSSLLSVEDGVATVSISGPIIRKPDIFARVLMGATDSEEIGTAIQEAASRDDIKAVFFGHRFSRWNCGRHSRASCCRLRPR